MHSHSMSSHSLRRAWVRTLLAGRLSGDSAIGIKAHKMSKIDWALIVQLLFSKPPRSHAMFCLSFS